MQIALPGSLHRVIVSLCSSVHSDTTPQPRRTMQIALPGSLHRVIVLLCTHSQLSTTAEAHDADHPAGLAAACHRVAVHSLTTIHHSRGTQCRSPSRARCIRVVSSCRCVLSSSFQPRACWAAQSRDTILPNLCPMPSKEPDDEDKYLAAECD